MTNSNSTNKEMHGEVRAENGRIGESGGRQRTQGRADDGGENTRGRGMRGEWGKGEGMRGEGGKGDRELGEGRRRGRGHTGEGGQPGHAGQGTTGEGGRRGKRGRGGGNWDAQGTVRGTRE